MGYLQITRTYFYSWQDCSYITLYCYSDCTPENGLDLTAKCNSHVYKISLACWKCPDNEQWKPLVSPLCGQNKEVLYMRVIYIIQIKLKNHQSVCMSITPNNLPETASFDSSGYGNEMLIIMFVTTSSCMFPFLLQCGEDVEKIWAKFFWKPQLILSVSAFCSSVPACYTMFD